MVVGVTSESSRPTTTTAPTVSGTVGTAAVGSISAEAPATSVADSGGGAASESNGSSLPFTGSSSLPLALIGLGLVASGVMLAIGRGDRGVTAASASPIAYPGYSECPADPCVPIVHPLRLDGDGS